MASWLVTFAGTGASLSRAKVPSTAAKFLSTIDCPFRAYVLRIDSLM